MSQGKVYALSPVGRFVMGDLFIGSDKDMNGRPRLTQDGKPKMTFFIGLAVAKNDPGFAPLWQQIAGVAQRDFPDGSDRRADFAWKVVDGDAKYPDKDWARGQWIFRLSSMYPPKVYNAANPPQQIVYDPANPQAIRAHVKRGDFIRVQMSFEGNDDRQKPGIYLNAEMVQVVGFGPEIVSGPSAAEVFAAPVAALPPGASATPVAPATMPAAGPAYAAPQAPATAYPTQAAPVAPAPAVPAGAPVYTVAPAAPVAPTTAYPTNQPHPAILNPTPGAVPGPTH